MDAESLTRYLRIRNLLEIKRIWTRQCTPGMLRKVGLLPQAIVQSVEAPHVADKDFLTFQIYDRFFFGFVCS